MSGFSDQGGQLRGSLIEAGLPAAAATIIANILANGVQTLRHGGEVIHDQTPTGLRQVTSDDRTHRLKNLDFRDGDPDYRRPQSKSSEEADKPTPADTVVVSTSPQQSAESYRVAGGAYIDATPAGNAVSVGLRVSGAGDCLFRDAANNVIVGKRLRAECDASDNSRLRFFIESRADENVFKIALQNIAPLRVVTGITYVPRVGFQISYSNIYAWAEQSDAADTIPVTPYPFVDEVTMGDGGIRVQRRNSDQLYVWPDPMVNVIPVTDCPT